LSLAADYFFYRQNAAGQTELVFRVNTDGYKSPNSLYPRTELRELGLVNGKYDEVLWSITDQKYRSIQTTGTVNKFTNVSAQNICLQRNT
jgi:hypothetical protein